MTILQQVGSATTAGSSAGFLYMLLVRWLAGGETETALLSGIPFVTGAVAVLVNRLSFLWNDPLDRYRDRQTRRAKRAAEREEEDELYAELRQPLIEERDAPGTTKRRQREINRELDELQKLFAAGKKKRLMERLGLRDGTDEG